MSHSVDIHVGRRLKARRLFLGLSQTDLAERVDVSYQQIQKYELGRNRVSASRLWEIAEALNVPVAFFFEGLSANVIQKCTSDIDAVMSNKDVVALVRAYVAMPEHQRVHVLNLAKALARDDVA